MAGRRADESRSYRSGDSARGRNPPPPRREERERYDRRDDRREERRVKYDGDRYDRRDTRDRDSYAPSRRSRSPDRHRRPDRERSRDRGRYPDDRHREDRARHDRDRDRAHDRDRDDRRRDRRDAYDGDRRRTSFSSAASPRDRDMKFRSRDRSEERLSPEEKQKREEEKLAKEKEEQQKARQAKVEAWKKKKAEELATKAAVIASPSTTAPSTPAPGSTPATGQVTPEPVKAKSVSKGPAEKSMQKQKSGFTLDGQVKVNPLTTKVPVPCKEAVNGNADSGVPPFSPAFKNPMLTGQDRVTAPPLKASGNISSFGLKAKPATDSKASKNALLDDDDDTSKRTLQQLPDFDPKDEPTFEGDDTAMDDIEGSDDEDANAQAQAQLEKRREELANEDTAMNDAPPAVDEADVKMADNDAASAEEDDVDPLDAFMAGLEPGAEARGLHGQTMFEDDNELTMDAVQSEDILAIAAAKKKKREMKTVNHAEITYEPFRKSFYSEPAEVTLMDEDEVANLRFELDGIKVTPDDAPRPVTKFAQMGLLQQTLDVFANLGYDRPTAIQCQAIPIAESGLDMIGVAKTGSGKTIAFGIPLIRHILDQPHLKTGEGPIVLILAPTRELAVQIVRELKPFLKASDLKAACAYGGAPIKDQIAEIKRGGIHVLCATPGRLIDLLQSNSGRVLNFRRVTYVILDEADRMFDMGFEPQVMKIMAQIRPDRQTALFSATFPKTMAALARKILTHPVEVIIGGKSVVAPEIKQIVTIVPPNPEEKMKQLLLQLGKLFDEHEEDDARALIFVEKQTAAEDLLPKITKRGYPCNTIHGKKDQSDRTDAINDFKNGALPVLIATSVAARGLDVPQLKLVINYDCPSHLEDYVHRCGRTGRAGNTGTAVTLIELPGQERFAHHLVKALKESNQTVPDDLLKVEATFHKKIAAGEEKAYGGFGGKGLERIDEKRNKERRREKQAFKAGDDADESEDEELEIPTVKKNVAEATKPATPAAVATPVAMEEEKPAWMKLLEGKIIVNKTERPSDNMSKPLTAMEKVKMASQAVNSRLSKKGMIHHGQPIDNKGPDAGAYHSTIEINDFPQKARWAVTNRTNVAKILEATGTSITTKGTYYPAGKQPGEGDLPKLYILVEGDTETVVTSAMMELTRLLKEGTMATDDAPARGATGRYSVV
ncbi:P-loop containing nucleoside triphosphate hydrolase protein [Lindgomyces ingoldianus]|uniref:P-loop containing nucleoside triphosphate hydrolase protein n=1 Tax=Lindgomyces ingoldianus TaxID=673940 RepID=A0ACB6R1T1_9PLEO|nr:P-loop containing nucleoside triphosphate hydrolase protein [Lindgomyces ingoldianus]KAF2472295.1 P-loop containing nucleoside triphosphate hydrolase protein [Lindgomyces ingoldianus]